MNILSSQYVSPFSDESWEKGLQLASLEEASFASSEKIDPIPLEDEFAVSAPNETGITTGAFYAFNTLITLQAFGEEEICRQGFEKARYHCRRYERLFSRMLPHSDIARLNEAQGVEVEIHADTFCLLRAAQYYCNESKGLFDITIGPAIRCWDFQRGIIPDRTILDKAMKHVDWHTLVLRFSEDAQGTHFFACLGDPQAALDVGGLAKGYIADRLAEYLYEAGLLHVVINLGGNVVVKGEKPDGTLWRVGLQDPKDKKGVVGALEISESSVVTSGVYERCFTQGDVLYHHILDSRTGFPVNTDVAGVSVVAAHSLDAEGFSTTLLALGIEEGSIFAHNHPAIQAVYFVDFNDTLYTVQ